MLEFFMTFLGGAIFVIAVISGIGPQNLNTMSHAIYRNHEYWVAGTCFIADSILIVLACIGLQLSNSKILITSINLVGIIFLAYYMWLKLKGLNKPHDLRFANVVVDRKTAIIRALGLTWLNPLVFIDIFIVIGGASTHYQGVLVTAFTLGAVLADFVWLFGITFIARTFATKLNRPSVWMVLDITTILLVAYILIKMILFFIK